MASVATLERLSQAPNPKIGLINELGDLTKISVIGNRVLVAIYIAPEKTAGGVYRSTQTLKEDVYQGTVGLVIKKGKRAFHDDENVLKFFHDESVDVGDWVLFRQGDGKRVQINGVDCRLVEDTIIDGVLFDPEIITHK